MKMYCADIETDGFNSTKIHVLSIAELQDMKEVRSFSATDYDKMRELMEEDAYWIFHNGMRFDKIELERILGIEMKGTLIDTLAISWYLEPKKMRHGLADYGEEFGIPKPVVDDWENLPLQVYVDRCEEDVKIQVKLWQRQWKHLNLLYDTPEDSMSTALYLSNKLAKVALQKKGWKVDIPASIELARTLEGKYEASRDALEKVMPMVPVYANKTRPKKPYKKNGELSATGLKWKELTEEYGKDFDYSGDIKVQTSLKEPNAGSPKQLKDWLFDLGWEPSTFDFKRDKETGDIRRIPQIKNSEGDDCCDSVKKLYHRQPALEHLSDMGVVKHRISVVKGFINSVDEKGMVFADCSGFTNTLRLKHRTVVNVPSGRKPYGMEIRALLTARNSKTELVGSDMCSLEDRTKQHYMWDYDKEYVKTMMVDDFDPHLDLGVMAGAITEEEAQSYKDKSCPKEEYERIGVLRYAFKTGNYACTYGAGAEAVARGAGVSTSIGEQVHTTYWKRNWSLKAIAEACVVKSSRGMKWLHNPVSGLWLHLKSDKDRFSTLNQSTGSFLFDAWCDNILAKRPQINGQFHDEVILELNKGYRDQMTKLLKDSIQEVNEQFNLNRDLDVDIDFGDDYSAIH